MNTGNIGWGFSLCYASQKSHCSVLGLESSPRQTHFKPIQSVPPWPCVRVASCQSSRCFASFSKTYVLRKDISRASFLVLQVPDLQPRVPSVESCGAVDTGLWLSVLLFPNSRPVMGWEEQKRLCYSRTEKKRGRD